MSSHEFLKTKAVAFAVRAGHTDAMAQRFLEALCDAGVLGQERQYGPTLSRLMREDRKAADADAQDQAGPLRVDR